MICDLRIMPHGYNHHQMEADLKYIHAYMHTYCICIYLKWKSSVSHSDREGDKEREREWEIICGYCDVNVLCIKWELVTEAGIPMHIYVIGI